MLLILAIAAVFLLSLAGERFYARHADAAQMARARVMFMVAAGIAALALVVATVKWL